MKTKEKKEYSVKKNSKISDIDFFIIFVIVMYLLKRKNLESFFYFISLTNFWLFYKLDQYLRKNFKFIRYTIFGLFFIVLSIISTILINGSVFENFFLRIMFGIFGIIIIFIPVFFKKEKTRHLVFIILITLFWIVYIISYIILT